MIWKSEKERTARRKLMTEFESKRNRTSDCRIKDLKFLDFHLQQYNAAHNTNLTIAGLSEELENLEKLAQTEADRKLLADYSWENFYRTERDLVQSIRASPQ